MMSVVAGDDKLAIAVVYGSIFQLLICIEGIYCIEQKVPFCEQK
jgi:Ca2+/Na+ antiporter